MLETFPESKHKKPDRKIDLLIENVAMLKWAYINKAINQNKG